MGRDQATAIILCGGRARRFGGGKTGAFVGGRAVIDRVLEVVRPLCPRALAVTAAGAEGLRLPADVVVVRDEYPGGGPLGGICSGLRAAPSGLALVVGADMPFLSPAFLRRLLDLAGGWDAVAPRQADGYVQPLHAAYSRAALPAMERHLAAGRLAVWRALAELHTRYVAPAEYLPLDPDGLSFFNLNTPEDLEQANRIAAARESEA